MRIYTRHEWGAQYDDGFRDAPVPADETWLHHSVTAQLAPNASFHDEVEQMRLLERIGENRFGGGISYTFPIMPSGRIYHGHSPNRQGAHTGGRNDIARAICFVGNYERYRPTRMQIVATAWLLAHGVVQGWWKYARLDGGHRDLKSTACPGLNAYRAIPEINRLAVVELHKMRTGGGGSAAPAPREEDEDMGSTLLIPATTTVLRPKRTDHQTVPCVGAEQFWLYCEYGQDVEVLQMDFIRATETGTASSVRRFVGGAGVKNWTFHNGRPGPVDISDEVRKGAVGITLRYRAKHSFVVHTCKKP